LHSDRVLENVEMIRNIQKETSLILFTESKIGFIDIDRQRRGENKENVHGQAANVKQ